MVNVVVGPGRTCGQRLVEHPDVAKIAFTGSTEVGRSIAATAAATIKRVTLELGGKSANLIFADADLEAAAAAAPWAVFDNAGQDCCARSRVLVEESAFDRFTTLFAEHVRAIRVGDPLDPATEMGPLISAVLSATPSRRSSTTATRSLLAAARPKGLDSGLHRRSLRPSLATPA